MTQKENCGMWWFCWDFFVRFLGSLSLSLSTFLPLLSSSSQFALLILMPLFLLSPFSFLQFLFPSKFLPYFPSPSLSACIKFKNVASIKSINFGCHSQHMLAEFQWDLFHLILFPFWSSQTCCLTLGYFSTLSRLWITWVLFTLEILFVLISEYSHSI